MPLFHSEPGIDRIEREPFTANQSARNTGLNNAGPPPAVDACFASPMSCVGAVLSPLGKERMVRTVRGDPGSSSLL